MFTILLVEDDPGDLELLRYAFGRFGEKFRLGVARDGVEMQEYLLGAGKFSDRTLAPVPDLVLLDLHLPRVSGFEALEWMRKQSAPLQGTPVIVLTSSPESKDIDRAYALGANSFLIKESDAEKMAAVIRTIAEYAELIVKTRRRAV